MWHAMSSLGLLLALQGFVLAAPMWPNSYGGNWYNNFSPYPPQQQNNAMPRYDNAASAYGLPTGQSTHPSHWSGTDSGAHLSSFDSSYGANIPASAYNERGIAQPHLPGAPPAHHQRAWLHEMPPSTPTHQDIVERIMRDSHHHEHASPTPWIPGYQDEQAFVNSFLRDISHTEPEQASASDHQEEASSSAPPPRKYSRRKSSTGPTAIWTTTGGIV